MKKTSEQAILDLQKARGQTYEECISFLIEHSLSQAPNSYGSYISSLRQLSNDEFIKCSEEDGLAKIKYNTGKTFYGHLSKKSHEKAFHMAKDLIPSKITPETFLLALDIAHRYVNIDKIVSNRIQQTKIDTIIECGAYCGIKSIFFVEKLLDTKGKYYAVEMMPDNYKVLEKNIEVNNLQHIIEPINLGIWDTSKEMKILGKGRQRNTLCELDKLETQTTYKTRTITLDTLIDKLNIETVDFLYITINGAELEALNGLNENALKCKNIFIASPYERNGQKLKDQCVSLLKTKGFKYYPKESIGGKIYVGI